MSSLVLARLSSRRSQLVSTIARVRAFDRRAGIFDRARYPRDYYDALTLVRRGF